MSIWSNHKDYEPIEQHWCNVAKNLTSVGACQGKPITFVF